MTTPIREAILSQIQQYRVDFLNKPPRLYENADEEAAIRLEALLTKHTERAVLEGRIEEVTARKSRLEPLLKKNYEVGTGDLAGFNSGINAVLNDDCDRLQELKTQLEAKDETN